MSESYNATEFGGGTVVVGTDQALRRLGARDTTLILSQESGVVVR